MEGRVETGDHGGHATRMQRDRGVFDEGISNWLIRG